MKIFHYPKCSTCRQAIKFLSERDIQVKAVNIAENPPSEKELAAMLSAYQGERKKLFNTSGMRYRELDLKNKLPAMNDEDAIKLLASEGMLVKRPFLIARNGPHLLGFRKSEWEAAL